MLHNKKEQFQHFVQTQLNEPQRKAVEKNKGSLKVVGGKVFNIKNMDVEIPLGKMTIITGVSGSGKSSFMYEILYKNL